MNVKRLTTTLAAALAATAAVLTAGATGAQADIVPLPPTDVAEMAESIEQALGGGNTVGFAYAIARNGQLAASDADGKARTGPDGDVNMTTTTRMEIASSTKNFTAAAVLKLLEANNLSPDTPIRAYLPSDFQQQIDSSWNDVTFELLLSHTSGMEQLEQSLTAAELANWSTLYSGLRFAVTKQIVAPSTRLYTNMNYAMARLTIPRLWDLADPGRGVPAVTSTNSGAWALAYVNEELLTPAGIAPTSCVPANPATAALSYDVTNPAAGGSLFQLSGANFEACAGHRGLYLSARDLVRWQVYLRHTNVVSDQVRAQMDTDRLGWQPGSNSGSNVGIYWHDGDLLSGNRELHTCHAKFPGNIEASVIMNSRNLGGVSECSVLINAFKAAS